jgi:selenide,water dikinase
MIKLTQTVQKGGCAAKVAASELRKILDQVKFPPQGQNILVDGSLFDDAAVDLIRPDLALVQTLDFFTPIVDSPRSFGAIAAANALSDVFAMGATPRTALAILAFPLAEMDPSVVVEVLQGASDKIAESGAAFVGGHSIDDGTLKFGLSVTGEVNPNKIWKNSGAMVGDHLILTKPLGTGTATAALKRQAVNEDQIQDEISSMARLNHILPFLSGSKSGTSDQKLHKAIHGATDVTGFGLAGHAYQMAKASRVSFRIRSSACPRFTKTLAWIEEGFLTKAHRTNREYTEKFIIFCFDSNSDYKAPNLANVHGASSPLEQLFFDPQTSGGLLLSVAADQSAAIVGALAENFPGVAVIGEVGPEDSGPMILVH